MDVHGIVFNFPFFITPLRNAAFVLVPCCQLAIGANTILRPVIGIVVDTNLAINPFYAFKPPSAW